MNLRNAIPGQTEINAVSLVQAESLGTWTKERAQFTPGVGVGEEEERREGGSRKDGGRERKFQ